MKVTVSILFNMNNW